MPWTVKYDPELGVVETTAVGRVTADEFKEVTIDAIRLAQANNTNRFLLDDSKWEGGASVFGLFELPALYEELKADRNSKAALILPPPGTAGQRDARFYETVCRNRGWNVQVFSERQEAIDWLLDKEISNKPDAGHEP